MIYNDDGFRAFMEILMLVHVPDHFSTKLRFNLKKLPAKVVDRSGLRWILSGWFLGALMLWLGIFELFSFVNAEESGNQSFIVVEMFAFIVILIALGLIIYSYFSFVRCKKFYFDGDEFHIVYSPAIGIKHQFRESIHNYVGVRLRVLFIQSGLFNKNRYIIDLYHPDSNKIVPLYISTNNKNIRKIWEDYARFFELPALSVGERGLVQRDYEDLDKSLKELASDGKIPFIAGGKFPAPDSLDVVEMKNITKIKPKRIYWDTFSALFLFISIAAIFILLGGAIYVTIVGNTFPFKYLIWGVILAFVILFFATKLFQSCTLLLANDRIIVHETLFASTLTSNEIQNDKIENIELSYNPTISRYSLAIISDDKIITFGSRLPASDLLWLKDFITRKLIGN